MKYRENEKLGLLIRSDKGNSGNIQFEIYVIEFNIQ